MRANPTTAKRKPEYCNSLAHGRWTSVDVPEEAGVFTDGHVTFTITGADSLNVTATIASAASANGKLFGHCAATE